MTSWRRSASWASRRVSSSWEPIRKGKRRRAGPRHLVAADFVAVPQPATTDTVGQVPAKIFDAMALARPIVSTAVSMIPEMLDGCGVLVPPGDAVALAASL